MFINNLGECEKSFYLGKCNNCNYCNIRTKIDYLYYLLEQKEKDLYLIQLYLTKKEYKEYLIDLYFLEQKIKLLNQELKKIREQES